MGARHADRRPHARLARRRAGRCPRLRLLHRGRDDQRRRQPRGLRDRVQARSGRHGRQAERLCARPRREPHVPRQPERRPRRRARIRWEREHGARRGRQSRGLRLRREARPRRHGRAERCVSCATWRPGARCWPAAARTTAHGIHSSTPPARTCVFSSIATDVRRRATQTPESDIHMRDLETGALRLVSATPQGIKGDTGSYNAAISDDGTVVAFLTGSSTLLPAGVTDNSALVVRDLARGTLVVADRENGAGGALSGADVNSFALSGDGHEGGLGRDRAAPAGPVPASRCTSRDLVTSTTVIGSRADGPDGAPSPSTPATRRSAATAPAWPSTRRRRSSPAPAPTTSRSTSARSATRACRRCRRAAEAGTAADTTAPVLSGVRLSRKRFAIGARRPRGWRAAAAARCCGSRRPRRARCA